MPSGSKSSKTSWFVEPISPFTIDPALARKMLADYRAAYGDPFKMLAGKTAKMMVMDEIINLTPRREPEPEGTWDKAEEFLKYMEKLSYSKAKGVHYRRNDYNRLLAMASYRGNRAQRRNKNETIYIGSATIRKLVKAARANCVRRVTEAIAGPEHPKHWDDLVDASALAAAYGGSPTGRIHQPIQGPGSFTTTLKELKKRYGKP